MCDKVLGRGVPAFLSLLIMLGGLVGGPHIAALANDAVWSQAQNHKSEFLHTYSFTQAPAGYVQYCRENPADCRAQPYRVQLMPLTQSRWDELLTVNELVNKIVRPVSDYELHGQLEKWSMPTNKGDCEDYVLMKRRLLMKRGWPASVLLITVVKDEQGEGHAILSVRTDRGDIVLDNKTNQILIWNDTGYQFFKWQSPRDPKEWFSLLPKNLTELLTATAIDRQLD